MANPESGRHIVLGIVLATVGISAIVIAVYISANGLAALPQRAIRFALTVALGVFLYRGAIWARWTAVVLFTISSLGALVVGVQLVAGGHPSNGAPLLLMGVIYGGSVLALLFVPAVRAHFAKAGAA